VLKLHQHQLPSVTDRAVSDRANIVTNLGVSSVMSEATRVVGPSLSVVKVELRVCACWIGCVETTSVVWSENGHILCSDFFV